jgi:hypothetical protein
MQFLYPVSKQFPFDVVCSAIVRSLEERNWDVPGMSVKLDTYGPGCRLVRDVRGTDFRLHFGRPQGSMPGGWNDTAAISDIVIPKKKIVVYDDESGPRLYLYVGDDWERDREEFMIGPGVNSKLNRKPRKHLVYSGGCNCQATAGASFEATSFILAESAAARSKLIHRHRGRRSPLLVHDNDLGREYDPLGDEPTMLQTVDVMEEFTQYLETVVLKMINAHPIPA